MKLEELAVKVIEAAEKAGIPFMMVGAIPAGTYGVPRSTLDIDVLVSVEIPEKIDQIISELAPFVEFDRQVTFDTVTWGNRIIGKTLSLPPFKVELFETFKDPFVESEFSRRRNVFVPLLQRTTWLPTAEDLVVQKLRWGRNKDLDDARDVLAVQGPENLDMDYVSNWCEIHGTITRLEAALAEIPPL